MNIVFFCTKCPEKWLFKSGTDQPRLQLNTNLNFPTESKLDKFRKKLIILILQIRYYYTKEEICREKQRKEFRNLTPESGG